MRTWTCQTDRHLGEKQTERKREERKIRRKIKAVRHNIALDTKSHSSLAKG